MSRTGTFDLIYTDPPWSYNQRFGPGTRFGVGAGGHYGLMTDKELLALPVSQIASKNAVLLMWATWPRLDFAMELIKAWGFTYKTCGFDWFKVDKNGSLFFGVGYYSKSNSEPCLLAIRGKSIKPATDSVSMAVEDWHEAFKGERREHSRKPDQVAARIEQMYPNARKLEMFARRPRKGWVTWGNELCDSALLDTLQMPSETVRGQPEAVSLFAALGENSQSKKVA